MTMLFSDSFDHYTTAAQMITKGWQTVAFASGGIAAGGRNGTNACVLNSTNVGSSWVRLLLPVPKATLIVGASFRFTALSQDTVLFALEDSATGAEQLSVRIASATGRLYISRNGTTLATGTTTLVNGATYYIELKATINSVSGSYSLHINTVAELAGSGVNTRGTGTNNSADLVRLGSTVNVNVFIFFYDDFYICDTAGADNNDFLGDVRVQCVFPNADGATSSWTPNSGTVHNDRVRETTPDDDTTYLSSATIGQIDSWAYGDVTPTTGTVKAIQLLPYVRKDDAGVRTIAPGVRIGGTDYPQANANLGNTYQYLPQIVERSPATAVPFTIAEVNAMEGLIKMVA